MSQVTDDVVAVLTAMNELAKGNPSVDLDEVMPPLMEAIIADRSRLADFMSVTATVALMHVHSQVGEDDWPAAVGWVTSTIVDLRGES